MEPGEMMLWRYLRWPAGDLYVDLGTATTHVCAPGKGILLEEPSVVALRAEDARTSEPIAVGSEAQRMSGRVPPSIATVRPLRDGVITDVEMAAAMLRGFLRRSRRWLSWPRPRVVVSVPAAATPVERAAAYEAARRAGVRSVTLIEEPMAAAVGAALPALAPHGQMIVDIGGGITEAAVIARGGIVERRAVRVGGDRMDEVIVRAVRNRYDVLIGERTAEQVKIAVASALPDEAARTVSAKGRDLRRQVPRLVEVSSEDVRTAIDGVVVQIVGAVKATLASIPTELAGDVNQRGIVLTGGGALIRGMGLRIARETGIRVRLTPRPLSTVALGGQRALESHGLLRSIAIPPDPGPHGT